MKGKIFLVLALVASLAVATNIVGTTFANKLKDDDRKQGGACQSFENRDDPKSGGHVICHSFGGDQNIICGPSSPSNIESCAKQNP